MEHIKRKEMDEKSVKIFINRLLRFIESEKKNLSKDAEMYSFICEIDNVARNIFIRNKNQKIYKKHATFSNFIDNLTKRILDASDDGYKDRKLMHIDSIEKRIKTLRYFSFYCEQNVKKRERLALQEEAVRKHIEAAENVSDVDSKKTFYADYAENYDCAYYPSGAVSDGAYVCLCGMDMTFCSRNCAFATTLPYPLRTKAYDAETYVSGGISGPVIYNKGKHGNKIVHTKKSVRHRSKVTEREWKENTKLRYSDIVDRH